MSEFTRFDAQASVSYSEEATKLLGKTHWVLTNDFTYHVGKLPSDLVAFVPRGFITDGASVPRVFWSFFPPWGPYGQAAILHDYLCNYLCLFENGKKKYITRKQCDDIFLEAMDVLGVGKLARFLIHKAVRANSTFLGIKNPTATELKRSMEDKWRAENPLVLR